MSPDEIFSLMNWQSMSSSKKNSYVKGTIDNGIRVSEVKSFILLGSSVSDLA